MSDLLAIEVVKETADSMLVTLVRSTTEETVQVCLFSPGGTWCGGIGLIQFSCQKSEDVMFPDTILPACRNGKKKRYPSKQICIFLPLPEERGQKRCRYIFGHLGSEPQAAQNLNTKFQSPDARGFEWWMGCFGHSVRTHTAQLDELAMNCLRAPFYRLCRDRADGNGPL